MKFSSLKIAASLAVLATSASFAQTKAPEPDYTLAYNAGVVSDYRFRGIAQTGLKPAAQAGVDYANKNGIYLGAFTSNVSWVKDFNGATKGSYEVDLYGGYKGNVTKDIGFDIGLISYQYPGNNSGVVNVPKNILAGAYSNASTTEAYLGLSYDVFSLKYNRSTSNFLGNLRSSGSQYFDLSANFDVGNGFTVTPHLGRQTIPNNTTLNYSDYSLTVAKDLGNGLVATAAAIGTNTKTGVGTAYRDSNGKDLGKSTVVVGLKYNF